MSINNFTEKLGFEKSLLDTNNHLDFRNINREGDNYRVNIIREKILDDIIVASYVASFQICVFLQFSQIKF